MGLRDIWWFDFCWAQNVQIKYKRVLSYETTKQREVKNNFLNFYGPGEEE